MVWLTGVVFIHQFVDVTSDLTLMWQCCYQQGHGIHVHEISPKSHKFIHINNKLEN